MLWRAFSRHRLVGCSRGCASVFQPRTSEICCARSEWVEGFETEATPRPAKRRWSLYRTFAVEQKDGDVGDGGFLLHGAEGGGAVHAGHHDVHEDGVGFGVGGVGHSDAFGSGAGGGDGPAGDSLEREHGDLADVFFVVDDENAAHEVIIAQGSVSESVRWFATLRAAWERRLRVPG